jgi:hypothetical protein
MEMAEGLRRVVLQKYKEDLLRDSKPIIILGDRNSHLDSASARILEDRLRLSDFMVKSGVCRLSSKGVPLCRGGVGRGQRFASVLTTDPELRNLEGSHVYRGHGSWLDDILISTTSLRLARTDISREGDYDSGVIYEPSEASDHALVFTRLNW